MPARWILLAALTGFLSAGCFAPQQVVTERATKEFRCPKEQVQVEDLSGNAYRVWACGYKAIYVCNEHQRLCFKEAGSAGRGSPQGQGAGQGMGQLPNTAQPNRGQPNMGQPGFGTQPTPQPTPQPQPQPPGWQTPAGGQ